MRNDREIKRIIFGGICGGTGVTTVALSYAIELAKQNPTETILFVGSINQIEYMLDIDPELVSSGRGNQYNRYSLGNIVFAPFSKERSAIDAEAPHTIIYDRGVVYSHFNLNPNEKLFYCFPEGHSTIKSNAKFKQLDSGTIIRYELKTIFEINHSLIMLPFQEIPKVAELGKLIMEQVK